MISEPLYRRLLRSILFLCAAVSGLGIAAFASGAFQHYGPKHNARLTRVEFPLGGVHDLAIDGEGRVYVFSGLHSRVQRFGPDGRFQLGFFVKAGGGKANLIVDKDDQLHVYAFRRKSETVLTPDGDVVESQEVPLVAWKAKEEADDARMIEAGWRRYSSGFASRRIIIERDGEVVTTLEQPLWLWMLQYPFPCLLLVAVGTGVPVVVNLCVRHGWTRDGTIIRVDKSPDQFVMRFRYTLRSPTRAVLGWPLLIARDEGLYFASSIHEPFDFISRETAAITVSRSTSKQGTAQVSITDGNNRKWTVDHVRAAVTERLAEGLLSRNYRIDVQRKPWWKRILPAVPFAFLVGFACIDNRGFKSLIETAITGGPVVLGVACAISSAYSLLIALYNLTYPAWTHEDESEAGWFADGAASDAETQSE